MLELSNYDFIVGPYNIKRYFLNKKSSNYTYNFKFLTKEELERLLFGKVEKETILYLIKKYNYTFLVASKIISYINKGGEIELREELIKNNLIKIDKYNKKLFLNKKILFVSYGKNNEEIKHIIQELNLNNSPLVKYQDFNEIIDHDNSLKSEENNKKTYKFNNIEEEVKYLLDDLSFELDKNKDKNKNEEKDNKNYIEPKNVKIFCLDIEKYKYYLINLGNLAGLKFNFPNSKTLFDTELSKVLFKKLSNDEQFNLKDYLESNCIYLSQVYPNYEEIKKVIFEYDIDNLNNKILNFKEVLQGFSLNNERFLEGIDVINSCEFDENCIYYFLGLNDNGFPNISVNNDFYDDEYKEKIKIETSLNKNTVSRDLALAFLKFNQLKMSLFHSIDISGKYEFNFLAENLGYKPIEPEIAKTKIEYSPSLTSIYYQNFEYIYQHYHQKNKLYLAYKKNEALKLEKIYSSEFKKMTNFNLDLNFIYSFSNMSSYYSCPFYFYCAYILKLGEFEENFSLKYGTMAHSIFEKVYQDTPFDELAEEYLILNDNLFSKKEKLFIKSLLPRLKILFDEVRSRKNIEKFDKKPLSEYKITINLPDNHKFEGTIDSIVFLQSINTNNKFLYLVDYKTGNVNFEPKYIKEGYKNSIQLPAYLYLIRNYQKFNEYTPIGLYIQPLLIKQKDLKEELDLSLKGITLYNEDAIKSIDNTLNDSSQATTSRILEYDEKSKDLYYFQYKNLFTEDGLNNIYNDFKQLLNDFSNNLKQGNFKIMALKGPKSNDSIQCEYCNFYDICYLKNQRVKQLSSGDKK